MRAVIRPQGNTIGTGDKLPGGRATKWEGGGSEV